MFVRLFVLQRTQHHRTRTPLPFSTEAWRHIPSSYATQTQTRTQTHIHTHTQTQTYTHKHKLTHTNTNPHTPTHKHTHAYTNIHTHVQAGATADITLSERFYHPSATLTYKVSGLPGDSGLELSADGVFSGTPTAGDAGASPIAAKVP